MTAAGSSTRSPVRKAIGVDLGGTKLAAGVIDRERRIYHRTVEPVRGASRHQLLARMVTAIRSLLARHPEVETVGVGVPCSLDGAGRVTSAVNLPLAGLPLRKVLADHLERRVVLDNDANVAALAEHRHGAARGVSDAVVLTIGTGVGGGVILDGHLVRTGGGFGPELGHVVIDLDGPPCPGACANRGCVESLVSGTALAREAELAAVEHPESSLGQMFVRARGLTGRDLVAAARTGDGIAERIVERAGARLGVALASYANIFGPQRIVVGGGLAAAAGEMLLDPARGELRSRGLGPVRSTAVEAAALGPDAGMIGAAVLALDSEAADK